MDSDLLRPPKRMFDISDGTVSIRLVPFYLDHMHGAWPAGTPEDKPAALPFPLLPGAAPVDIQVRGGMKPKAMSAGGLLSYTSSLDDESWWSWAAYALTPFGWSAWPTPFFKKTRLDHLEFSRSSRDDESNFDVMLTALTDELGAPTEFGMREGPRAQKKKYQLPDYVLRFAVWTYAWGVVELSYEPIDHTCVLVIEWNLDLAST